MHSSIGIPFHTAPKMCNPFYSKLFITKGKNKALWNRMIILGPGDWENFFVVSDGVFFSSQCKRVSVKTSKKGKTKMKCRHEALVGLFHFKSGEEDPDIAVDQTCSFCNQVFRTAGGQCKFCTTPVSYCSRNCQVHCFLNVFAQAYCVRCPWLLTQKKGGKIN